MKIVGYHSRIANSKVLLQDSSGEDPVLSTNLGNLFNFLLEPYDRDPNYQQQWGTHPIVVRLTWNLDEFIAPILRLLGEHHCRELAETKETRWQGYRLFYIPRKVFSVKYGKYFAQFYSLDQYYQDTVEPPVDAFEVRYLGKKLEEVLGRMNLKPSRWTSPASILRECVLEKMEIPTVWDNEHLVRRESVNYALRCCHRLWISNFKVGFWPEGTINDFDLQSAFPSEAMQLYDTRPENCKYIKSDKFIPDADWGFLYGNITINKDFSPIMHLDDNGELRNPIGQWRGHITLDEVTFIEKHKLGTFKLNNGWFLKFKSHQHIFDDALQKLYSYRGKHFLTDALAKRMMNSLYGLTIEKRMDGQSGKFFNPFFAATITTRCRLKVAEFILANELQDHLVSVTVDGCLTDKPVAESELGSGMGKWKFAGSDATIVVSPGLIFRADKKPHGINYQVLKEMIEKHPNSSIYSVDLIKRVTMGEALRIDFSLIGKIQKFGSTIDLYLARTSQDRFFKKFPKTGKELLERQYTSKPVEI
ncbi:DNA polymerase [Chloroflexota bacterium]